MLKTPKQRLMSAFVGRKNRQINGQIDKLSTVINELDCLMECDRVIQVREFKGSLEDADKPEKLKLNQLIPNK